MRGSWLDAQYGLTKLTALADLRLHVFKRRLLVASHDEIGEAAKGFDCRLAWIVASDPEWPVLKEFKQSTGLRLPRTSPRNYAVGSPPQGGFQEIVEGNGCLVGIGLAFDGKEHRYRMRKFRMCPSIMTMRSCSGIRLASMLSKVFLPVPVPPLMRQRLSAPNLFRQGTQRVARVSVRERCGLRPYTVGWKIADNQRWGQTATGGMTAAERLPSGS